MDRGSLAQIEQQLVEHLCCRDERVDTLHQLLLHLLTKGRPISIATLAETLGWELAEVEEVLAHVPDLERDLTRRVVGWGLTLLTTPHRIQLQGRTLNTWCAFDTLIYPVVLDINAQVESHCPTTQQRISFDVSPLGITNAQPAQAVISLALPTARQDCTREKFCEQSHFFASHAAASSWPGAHTTPTLLTLAEAALLGHQVATARLKRSSRKL